MISLRAKIRQDLGKKVKELRKKGIIPAILYGPKIENLPLEVDSREFEKIYQEAGESTLISLDIPEKKLKPPVLIYNVQFDPVRGQPIHVDFYQAPLEEKIEAKVPLVFEEEAPAVKELQGTLIKVIHQLEIKALPQNLPKEIKVDVSSLKTFDDAILIKNLELPAGVEILRDPEEIVAEVSPPEKVEEELVKPIEEKVEEVEKVEEKKEEEEEKSEAKK